MSNRSSMLRILSVVRSALFGSARFTAQYVRSVGQDVSPGKCVLLNTSKSVRKAMKLWDISGDGSFGLFSGSLLLVRYLWDFRKSWGWFVVSTFLPVSMLLKLLMSPPRLSVLFGLLLYGQYGPLKRPYGPVGIDPAFHIVWASFRMMRRYLVYCPEEEPRIFRMLDLISRGAQGHGPVHLLLISAAELGFARDDFYCCSLCPLVSSS